MRYNWKAYLARKKQSLKGVVEHYQIKNYNKLKSLFLKQGLTVPTEKEFESAKESVKPEPELAVEEKVKQPPVVQDSETPQEVSAEESQPSKPKPKRQPRRKRKQDGNAKIKKG